MANPVITSFSNADLQHAQCVVVTGLVTVAATADLPAGTILGRRSTGKYVPIDTDAVQTSPIYASGATIKAAETLTLGSAAIHAAGTLLAHDGTTWILYVPGADGDPDPVAAATPRGVLLTATAVVDGTTPEVDVLVAGEIDIDSLLVAGSAIDADDENALRSSGIVPVEAIPDVEARTAVAVLASPSARTGSGDIVSDVIIATQVGSLRAEMLSLADDGTVTAAILTQLADAGIHCETRHDVAVEDNS